MSLEILPAQTFLHLTLNIFPDQPSHFTADKQMLPNEPRNFAKQLEFSAVLEQSKQRVSMIYKAETVLESDLQYVPVCVWIMLPGDDGFLANENMNFSFLLIHIPPTSHFSFFTSLLSFNSNCHKSDLYAIIFFFADFFI